MSLRTKGLLLIVLISIIPLLLAGVSNYMTVREQMIDSAKEKTMSRLQSGASQLAAWLAIRRAEVLVMSRTDVVRFGTDEERLRYFNRELVRSGFTYHAIGFVHPNGFAIRTNGPTIPMGGQSFFLDAIEGKVTITDPMIPFFENDKQSFIVVPVYGDQNKIIGVVYASMQLSVLEPYLRQEKQETGVFRMFNREGEMIYSAAPNQELDETIGFKEAMEAKAKGAGTAQQEQSGTFQQKRGTHKHIVFYEKVDSVTGWRFSLEMPSSSLNEGLNRVFLQTFATIALAEIVVVILFFIFFATIVRRLEGILAVTEQAADGRFDAEHLNELPSDEVGKLAASVNGMMVHLKDMFEQLGAIINQNQYAFIVLDEHYRISYMNTAAEHLIGYKLEEVRGHATPLLFIDPEEIREEAELLSDRLGRTVVPGLELFHELRLENFSYEREWTFIHRSGTRIPVRHSSNGLRDHNGKFTGTVGMAYDISEHLQMEKMQNRLLDIVGSAQDLIASVDHRGRIIYMNTAGKEMLALDASAKYTTLKRHLEPPAYQELINGARIAERLGFWEGNAELLTCEGKKIFVSMVVVAHANSRTGELFYSCIARDVSEQQRIQEELIRATQEAEEANTAKSSFLALMSHEIRTPLNGIIGLAQLMRRTGLSASQKDYMDKINTSSDTLLRIINDILDFSKIEAGKVEPERLAFKPEELLHRLADQLSIFMGGKEQFEFILDSPKDLPITLVGDPLRLEQILLNLCMNAIKFTSQGRVMLRLTVLDQQEDSLKLRFMVEDTGIGMSQEQVDKLFVPFTQADSSTTRKFGGTGLGLVISNAFVEMMGGKLQVESELGAGSRFQFELRFALLPNSAPVNYSIEGAEQQKPIWIVEDNDEMRLHWYKVVDSFGLTPVPFYSWKSARARLKRVKAAERPKLIMLDMEMPDMYGAETWLAFHKEAEAAGVQTAVFTTSFGRDELLQMPESERPSALLTKPVTRQAMYTALSRLMIDSASTEQRRFADHALREAAAEAAVSMAAGPASGVRILLAEDNAINQMVAQEMLKAYGFEVGVAANGKEALQMLEQEEWQLILMDIHMPEMDGMEATRIIRDNILYRHIPIIAVTANTLRSDHETYMRIGMNGVVTKPINAEQLYSAIALSLHLPLARSLQDKLPGAPALIEHTIPAVEGIDLDAALARVNGKQMILLHMLDQFESDYSDFMDKLEANLQSGQLSTVKRMLHTLKGASSHLSAHSIACEAGALEAVVKREPFEEQGWEEAAGRLRQRLDETLFALKNRM
ncbi:response regulator [Paenibacillus radicis (ex Gao et al. 2016)]|nr:response regulator [Paenibacillus radicis (ex Gao et al. 2016)]